MNIEKPVARPDNAYFSSGPCAKYPTFSTNKLLSAAVGRSHRASVGKKKLKQLIDGVREILEVPSDYKVGIVPASDTGAVEMAMWSLLGARNTTMVAWESFGKDWINDVVNELKIDPKIITADYGHIVDMSLIDYDNDVVFTWNGTTSGVCMKNGDHIPLVRKGLTICDATSAAFAIRLPFEKLDVTTFSWQKVMGGEAAHGIIILSPKAIERLESHKVNWPIPKIFRMTKNNKLIQGIFEGATINTPSMLAVEDFLYALEWAREIGGLNELISRAKSNAKTVWAFCDQRDWIDNLAIDRETRSVTSVCLKFTDPKIKDGVTFSKAIVKRLEDEEVAYDIASYRDAPPGLRIWCGGTVNKIDLEQMLPWLEWAYHEELARQI